MMPLYFTYLLECTELLIDILVWRHFSQSDVHLSLAFRFFHIHCFQLVCDNVPFTLFNITVNSAVINKLRQDEGGQVLWCSGKRFCELGSAWYHVYFSVVDYAIHAHTEAVRYIFISKICFCVLMALLTDLCCEVKINNDILCLFGIFSKVMFLLITHIAGVSVFYKVFYQRKGRIC